MRIAERCERSRQATHTRRGTPSNVLATPTSGPTTCAWRALAPASSGWRHRNGARADGEAHPAVVQLSFAAGHARARGHRGDGMPRRRILRETDLLRLVALRHCCRSSSSRSATAAPRPRRCQASRSSRRAVARSRSRDPEMANPLCPGTASRPASDTNPPTPAWFP